MVNQGGYMNKIKKLTDAEWEIMNTIWELDKSPSVRNIWEHLYPNKEKAYTTIQTIMNTLVIKGHLKKEKIGLVNFYSPFKKRQDFVKSEVTNFISKIFNNSAPALASFLIRQEDIDLKDIQSLREIINKKECELKEEI